MSSGNARRLRNTLGAILVAAVALTIVTGAQVTVPFPNFVTGTIADPTQVNANFSALSNQALNRTGGTLTGTLNTQTVIPTADAAFTIGDGTHRYTTGSFSGTVTAGTFSGALSGAGAGITGILPTALTGSGRIPLAADYWPAYASFAADHTVAAAEDDLDCDATGAGRTFTLPTPVGISGKTYNVKKIDSTSNTCTVATAAGTIDGVSTFVIVVQYQNITFRSTGANWEIR